MVFVDIFYESRINLFGVTLDFEVIQYIYMAITCFSLFVVLMEKGKESAQKGVEN